MHLIVEELDYSVRSLKSGNQSVSRGMISVTLSDGAEQGGKPTTRTQKSTRTQLGQKGQWRLWLAKVVLGRAFIFITF